MTPSEIADALAATAPFDRLTDRERRLVAQQVRPRRFAPGALLVEAGQVGDLLHIVVDGSAMAGDRAAPRLFDVPSLLFSLPAPHAYLAGPDGLESLTLARPHLFTIARECPDFIVALLDLGALPPCA